MKRMTAIMSTNPAYQFQYHYQVVPVPVPQLPAYHVPLNSWPPPSSNPSPPSKVTSALREEECTILFVISAVLFSLIGGYLGGASANSKWEPEFWDWNDPNTPVAILSGAVGGILTPYGFFYANATLGVEGTMNVAYRGAYLGAAMVNNRWSPFQRPGWNWTSPSTYHGAFEGMQTTLWLIDATSSIHAFADEAGLQGLQRGAFVGLTYGTGAWIAYHYVSQYHDGNYEFWEWDRVREPGTLFAVIDGIESGTRLPVGFAEIGRDIVNRTSSQFTGPHGSSLQFSISEDTFADLDPWSFFGAGFMAFVYASEENRNFDLTKWDWSAFSTFEAIMNGIVYGKDLPEMVRDVKTAFKQKSQRQGRQRIDRNEAS